MLNKMERMNKLNAAGIDTRKYFTVDLDNGTKIQLIIDENGNVAKVDDDPIATEIIEDGYVRNSKLHRRFVMAQMFHMLNYVSYDGKYRGYNDCLKRAYGYEYTLKMMTEEIRVLSKLEVRDAESFAERSHFFNKAVVIAVLEDYLEKLKAYAEALPDRNCKGIPYKRIKGKNIFHFYVLHKIRNKQPSSGVIFSQTWIFSKKTVDFYKGLRYTVHQLRVMRCYNGWGDRRCMMFRHRLFPTP